LSLEEAKSMIASMINKKMTYTAGSVENIDNMSVHSFGGDASYRKMRSEHDGIDTGGEHAAYVGAFGLPRGFRPRDGDGLVGPEAPGLSQFQQIAGPYLEVSEEKPNVKFLKNPGSSFETFFGK
jgi:hypothetical protein